MLVYLFAHFGIVDLVLHEMRSAPHWCLYEGATPNLAQWAKEVSAPEFLRRNIWTSPSVVERT